VRAKHIVADHLAPDRLPSDIPHLHRYIGSTCSRRVRGLVARTRRPKRERKGRGALCLAWQLNVFHEEVEPNRLLI